MLLPIRLRLGSRGSPKLATREQSKHVSGLRIGRRRRNVVYRATSRNCVYAYDADDPAAYVPIWVRTLGPAVPPNSIAPELMQQYLNFGSEVGITSTPVIERDGRGGRIFVVAKTMHEERGKKTKFESRSDLRERDAAIRGFEQRALEQALLAKSKETALADFEKDLTSARASHAEVEAARAALNQRSVELAKALEGKDAALQRAEQKIEALESRITEQGKAMSGERTHYEEKLAKLKEQLEAEQAARAFAEGALQAARQERGVRRQDADSAAPKDSPAPGETAREKITRLRG